MAYKDVLDRKADIYYIEVLGKTLDILDVFTRINKPQLSLQDISLATGLSKNTVFRILYTLAEHGHISKEGHSYRLGQKIADLGSAKLHRQDLLALAGPYLDSLRDEFGETVNLGVLDGGCVRYIDVRESRKRFRFAECVGGSDPLHSTALGKAQLAFLPLVDVRQLMKEYGMRKYTEHTIVTIKALKIELEKIRADRYAVDRQESMLGAFCVAAPILDFNHSPVAAISVAGPQIRFGSSNLRTASSALLKAVSEIEKKLGY